MFNYFKKKAIENRINDEILYEYVIEELEKDIRFKGLWAKAYANSEGNENRIEPLYMQYRVQAIKDTLTSLDILYDELSRQSLFEFIANGFKNTQGTKIISSSPQNILNHTDIWIDNETGLMWQDDEATATVTKPWVTQSNYDAENYFDTRGDTASTYCSNLSLAGYSDWRLHIKSELEDLYKKKSELKNFISSYYWSSTTVEGYKDGAWSVYFYLGFVDYFNKDDNRYVRCVRAGQ
jgi:hypothetical protein